MHLRKTLHELSINMANICSTLGEPSSPREALVNPFELSLSPLRIPASSTPERAEWRYLIHQHITAVDDVWGWTAHHFPGYYIHLDTSNTRWLTADPESASPDPKFLTGLMRDCIHSLWSANTLRAGFTTSACHILYTNLFSSVYAFHYQILHLAARYTMKSLWEKLAWKRTNPDEVAVRNFIWLISQACSIFALDPEAFNFCFGTDTPFEDFEAVSYTHLTLPTIYSV